jgi:predicted ATPase
MRKRITVERLRHIPRLQFDLPGPGVWLLTGANGTGKTSLLGCLRRIGFHNAFPYHFPASRKSDRLDSYEGSSITYELGSSSVTYTYRTERWVPTPKANSKLLGGFGYPAVVYLAANAERIEPQKEDFSPRAVRPAPQVIIDAANRIFLTDKFDALKTINLRRGVGSQAFLIELPSPARALRYFSEKNLSLGELCILKLLKMMDACPHRSLVLIDEVELALHPTAQTELLEYLEEVASAKSLTIILSTHSATLIKQKAKSKLLFLQVDDDGTVRCIKNCFPSYVLGYLAYKEEAVHDVVIYVEDNCARVLVEAFVFRACAEIFPEESLVPSCVVIPVGGYLNVLRFFDRQRAVLPMLTRAYVVLDADAQLGVNAATSPDIVRIGRDSAAQISYLPFTPEVGLLEYLNRDRPRIVRALRAHYSANTLQLAVRDVPALPGPNDAKPRKLCKQHIDAVTSAIAAQLPNATPSDVEEVLFKLLAEQTYAQQRAHILGQFGPILRG